MDRPPSALDNRYSPKWGGYVQCVARNSAGNCAPGNSSTPGDDLVGGSWATEPIASTEAGTQTLLTMVGIGGYGTSDLAAAGTNATIGPSGSTNYSVWWELAPGTPTAVALSPTPTIHVHDDFNVKVTLASVLGNGTLNWNFSIYDVTTASIWTAIEPCYPGQCTASSFDSAEWVAAVPTPGGVPLIPPAFGELQFSSWYEVNGSSTLVGPIGGITLYLQNLNVSTGDLVLPSGIESTGVAGSQLYLAYLVDSIDPIFAGGCCVVTPSAGVPGTRLDGSVDLWAVDSFNGTGVGRLALVLDLGGPGFNCPGYSGANIGFNGVAGRISYPTSLVICANSTSGSDQLGYWLEYVPAGATPGAAGSLLMVSALMAFPSVTVARYNVSGPTISPPFGPTDVGSPVNLTATASITGNLSGPYYFSFPGAPAGCDGVVTSSTPAATLSCRPTSAGSYTIGAEMAASPGFRVDSGTNLTLVVHPKVAVNLTASADRLEFGVPVQLTANATGGDGVYSYTWPELPIGCSDNQAATLTCTPALYGHYPIAVNVTDDTVSPGAGATLSVEIAPPLIVLLLTNYSSVPAGTTVSFYGGVAGGFAPYRLAWSGLPAGCASMNATHLTCAPTGVGSWKIALTATDTFGASNSSFVWLNVTSTGGLGLTPLGWTVVGSIIAIAIIVPTVLVVRRRRRRQPPAA